MNFCFTVVGKTEIKETFCFYITWRRGEAHRLKAGGLWKIVRLSKSS